MKPLSRYDRSRCAPQSRIAASISVRLGARPGGAAGGGLGCRSSMVSSRSATGWPIAAQSGETLSRAWISASRSACRPRLVAQFGKAGPAQQRPQRRIPQRSPVEFAKMRVAAAIFQQQRIAHLKERRAVLAGRQRAVGGAGEILKLHGKSSRAAPFQVPSGGARCQRPLPSALRTSCKPLKNYTNSQKIQM